MTVGFYIDRGRRNNSIREILASGTWDDGRYRFETGEALLPHWLVDELANYFVPPATEEVRGCADISQHPMEWCTEIARTDYRITWLFPGSSGDADRC